MTTHNLLFVDDEINILNSLSRLFRKEKYKIYTSTDGIEALKIMEQVKISLVLSDQRMPIINGVDFLKEVKKLSPETIRIMLTGYTDLTTAMKAINEGEIFKFITKPWEDFDIKITVREALKQYELVDNNNNLNKLIKSQNFELQELNNNLEKKVLQRTKIILQKRNELDLLYKELEQNFFDSIKVFVGILELHNPFFGNHCKRTALFSRMIAKEMGLEEKDIETIEISAMLHDIGMIGIPKKITETAPDNLKSEEEKILQQHTIVGEAALKGIKKLDTVRKVIRSHHERFDGSGYPDGLKGEKIHIFARIVAIADYYDEFCTYHNAALNKYETKHLIIKNSGIIFDPKLIKHFISILNTLKIKQTKETPFSLQRLVQGMIISRDISTSTGLLVAKGTILNEIHINKIKNYAKIESIEDEVYIYTN